MSKKLDTRFILLDRLQNIGRNGALFLDSQWSVTI
jgi:hypothetical protein